MLSNFIDTMTRLRDELTEMMLEEMHSRVEALAMAERKKRQPIYWPPHWAESFRELIRPMTRIERIKATKMIRENLEATPAKAWRKPPATYPWERLF